MKKLLSLLLALALVFSLTACLTPTQGTPLPGQTTAATTQSTQPAQTEDTLLDRGGSYTTKEDVALYIHQYGCLPRNFLTKAEAQSLGWKSGALEPYAPGHCIGGDTFRNREGLLPTAPGRTYTECDIDTMGGGSRGGQADRLFQRWACLLHL